MQKFSFLKGLIIGGVLSAIFWIGTYKAVSSLTQEDTQTPQEEIIEHEATPLEATIF